MTELNGILPVMKPAGFTSHDVVAKLRRILHMKRIGHTGTLDPAVTGVLPICLGQYTRFVEYLQELPKQYEGVIRIGIATDTEDSTGTIIEQSDIVTITEEQLRSAFLSMLGEIEQMPPMYSAVKVDGKKLYELARTGVTIERKSRPVTIHELELLSFNNELPYPEAAFRVRCSKGTYVRTLCVDIGKKLGYPASMADLVRTQSGTIQHDSCLTLEQIAALFESGSLPQHFVPLDQALAHLPRLSCLSESTSVIALQGQKLNYGLLDSVPPVDGIYRVYSGSNHLLGLYETQPESNRLKPIKVFHSLT